MTQTEKTNGRVELLAAQGCFLRRKGSTDNCRDNVRLTVAAERVPEWEEVSVDTLPAYTEAQYKKKIVELIRERYDQDDENGFIRQRDTKPDEFAAYDAYVEECKQRARTELKEEQLTDSE